ncbi:hypothetical protein F5887DRAFT_977259 [Amanita rubescens]|nr:hypothetical protein F5887DRAFT_985300 [Amanita rubescens]KAF8341096.1 hypothetical protein F5887DRAFT_977259 [Amanita rubescens]
MSSINTQRGSMVCEGSVRCVYGKDDSTFMSVVPDMTISLFHAIKSATFALITGVGVLATNESDSGRAKRAKIGLSFEDKRAEVTVWVMVGCRVWIKHFGSIHEAYGRGSIHVYIGIDDHTFTLVISLYPSFCNPIHSCAVHGWHTSVEGQCQREKNMSFLVNTFTKHSEGSVQVKSILV